MRALCEGAGDVVGVGAPVGRVAQLLVMESRSSEKRSECMERKERKKTVKCGKRVKGEVEQLRDNRACAWREDGMTDSRDDLSQCGCDT